MKNDEMKKALEVVDRIKKLESQEEMLFKLAGLSGAAF